MTDNDPSRPEYGQPAGEGSSAERAAESNAHTPLGWDDAPLSDSHTSHPDAGEASQSGDWWAAGYDPQASGRDQLSGGWDYAAASESAPSGADPVKMPSSYDGGYPPYDAQAHVDGPQNPAYGGQMLAYEPPNPGYGAPAMGYNQFGGEQKSWLAAVLLCLFFGELGVHNFYIGQKQTGTVQLALYGGAFLIFLLTFGFGFFLLIPSVVWKFVDLIKLLTGSVSTDAQGIPLKR
ncbi:TM2 domain-containing protein [Corynebacterium sp. CCM 9185]|uniref:TM2 domain-containing protein n=1 Tax=Corynebacterium marambiense TaxID=2765364 RepID=A0ABS0VVQ4_9CORY|nr:TM2 domain-containing protein [Corynebacterium marambiense]MBI9000847.1 TM2 domain-containing protein [Corynebacterium marambiense]MCK7662885.1 TM2 domain-containing protein [Corynebacterium marambiense]